MATSETQIINSALGYLGVNPIMELNDNSPAVRKANVQYPLTRDHVLRLHPWNGAIEQVKLFPTGQEPDFGYKFQFNLPTNPFCLKVLSIDENYRIGEQSVYDFENFSIKGRMILSDESEIFLTYIKRIENPLEFDPLLVTTIATRLAYDLAYPITGSNTVKATMLEQYKNALVEARAEDGKEKGVLYKGSSYVRVRRGGRHPRDRFNT